MNRKSVTIMIMTLGLLIGSVGIDFKVLDLKILSAMLVSLMLFNIYGLKQKDTLRQYMLFQTLLTTLTVISLMFLSGQISVLKLVQPIAFGLLYLSVFNLILNMSKDIEGSSIERLELTPREHAVAMELLKGKSNKEIASSLYIAESTVKKHNQHIYQKAGVNNRKAFLAWAKENASQK